MNAAKNAIGAWAPAAMLVVVVCTGCAGPTEVTRPEQRDHVATSRQAADRLPGYLAPEERPDSAALLPPPPGETSSLFAADVEVYRATRALRNSPRWQLAAQDADLKFPGAANVFACALGVPVTAAAMPNLYELLQRTLVDAGQSTSAAKDKYQRVRPYVRYDEPICVPQDAQALRKIPSYPSGHASAGWAWALILAELAPDRTDAILRRGLEFGTSRVVCGVHWQSDVDAARTVASAVVARLHADPAFDAQRTLAARELAQARAAAPGPVDCVAEARALGDMAVR